MRSEGKYRRLAVIGHGGMADVHLAVACGPFDFHKLLVLKELRPGLAQDHELRAMFQQEARVAARMAHPNVVQTHEIGSVDGRPFIAMEFLDGQPLQRIVRRVRRDTGAELPLALSPQLATLVDDIPPGDDWLYEIKFDGYRLLTRVDGDDVRCFTRNGHDWSRRLPGLVQAVRARDIGWGWLDGEAAARWPRKSRMKSSIVLAPTFCICFRNYKIRRPHIQVAALYIAGNCANRQ